MRQEWWLEQRDHVWCVVGYNADDSLWVRPASEVEISLWQWLNSALKRAAVAEDALARLTWQPMDTAPNDGSWFLGWHEDYGCFIWRDGPGLLTGEDPAPTFWMPLPPAPDRSLHGLKG